MEKANRFQYVWNTIVYWSEKSVIAHCAWITVLWGPRNRQSTGKRKLVALVCCCTLKKLCIFEFKHFRFDFILFYSSLLAIMKFIAHRVNLMLVTKWGENSGVVGYEDVDYIEYWWQRPRQWNVHAALWTKQAYKKVVQFSQQTAFVLLLILFLSTTKLILFSFCFAFCCFRVRKTSSV